MYPPPSPQPPTFPSFVPGACRGKGNTRGRSRAGDSEERAMGLLEDCNQGGQQEGCFNCGGLDHWSRDCTRGGQQAACFNCGDPSHWSRDCPTHLLVCLWGEHAGHRGSDIQQEDLAVLDQPRGIVEAEVATIQYMTLMVASLRPR
uniref:CCHC-type domain-containing protein n=1 Tax=Neogobius melanostomus TaxID=47308 RepID=A0A8C6T950_9GOBI